MAKSKHGRSQEFYLGEIRKLKSENKSLKRRLKDLQKHEHMYEDNQLLEEEVPDCKVSLKEKCSECNEGFIEEMIILDRLIYKCTKCLWRSKAVKLD